MALALSGIIDSNGLQIRAGLDLPPFCIEWWLFFKMLILVDQ
jgi:hypothetical protein